MPTIERDKVQPDGQIRTLHLDARQHATAAAALTHAKELVMAWSSERGGDGREEG